MNAPERLLVFEANLSPRDVETIHEALADERRAGAVAERERITKAIFAPGGLPGATAATVTALFDILDAEQSASAERSSGPGQQPTADQ